MEAVIGAIYLDGGYQAMQNFAKKSFSRMIDQAIDGNCFRITNLSAGNPAKAKRKPVTIAYETDREEGPAREDFLCIFPATERSWGKGIGKSKKEAEQNAAKQTLKCSRGENKARCILKRIEMHGFKSFRSRS